MQGDGGGAEDTDAACYGLVLAPADGERVSHTAGCEEYDYQAGQVRRVHPPPSMPAASSIADELAALARARQNGHLSAEEFEAAKAAVLRVDEGGA